MNKRMNITIDGAFHGLSVTLRPEVTISGDGVIWQSMPVTVVDGVTVEARK